MVIHILKDGTRIDDLTGHVIRQEDAKGIRAIIEEIERRINGNQLSGHCESK